MATLAILVSIFVVLLFRPPCPTFVVVGATSPGQVGVSDGVERLPRSPDGGVNRSSGFFLDSIVEKFGSDGEMNLEELQILVQRSGTTECYTSTELLDFYSLDEDQLKNNSKAAIATLCPMMLYQTVSDDCLSLSLTNETAPPTAAEVWGYGILCVTIINLSSLLGAFLIPCMDKAVYKMVLTYLVGLAVGTLSGNAILSLIPETHGMLVSTHGLEFVWRNTTILGGIYLFFFVERILKLITTSKEARRKKTPAESNNIWHTTGPDSEHSNHYHISSSEGALDGNVVNQNSGTEEMPSSISTADRAHSHLALVENGPVPVASVAYMIIVGDGLHNFVDGLAIGASFALSVFQGVSTSIAVICEEFPHELGDFAILLKSGMTVKRALTFNLLSALTCYAGLAVGIVVGQLTSAEPYIFALAAGMFLYISLVDMLPELNVIDRADPFNLCRSLKIFAVQNAGLLTGFSIMIALAVYREEIVI